MMTSINKMSSFLRISQVKLKATKLAVNPFMKISIEKIYVKEKASKAPNPRNLALSTIL